MTKRTDDFSLARSRDDLPATGSRPSFGLNASREQRDIAKKLQTNLDIEHAKAYEGAVVSGIVKAVDENMISQGTDFIGFVVDELNAPRHPDAQRMVEKFVEKTSPIALNNQVDVARITNRHIKNQLDKPLEPEPKKRVLGIEW